MSMHGGLLYHGELLYKEVRVTTLTARTYAGEVDLQPICELLNTCDAVDDLDDNYDIAELRVEFADPRLDPERDLRLWEDAAGRLVGFGQVWVQPDGEVVDGFLYARVHPDARASGLDDEIIAWGHEQVRAAARERGQRAQLRTSTRDHDARYRSILERHGFAIARYFFRMTCPLNGPIAEPQLPAGFTLRHVVSDADIEQWVEAYNQSFVDHWNFHPRTIEVQRHWLTDPNYRPEHDLIAVAPDGTIAAFCLCIINAADNARNRRNEGWIALLGTRRGFRKIGLGRAMLLAGLRRLKIDGVEVARLGVDAANPTGALRLYESVGFRRMQTWINYVKDI